MDLREHWENIYKTKSVREVSWFSEHLGTSLELIRQFNIEPDSAIIDIGGGASTLADDLLNMGFADITVLDISGEALNFIKERLGSNAGKVKLIAENILTSELENRVYDLWHDRAVFHFLTDEDDREIYRRQLDSHLKSKGILIISGFADDGPLKCSGLNVRRHSEDDLRQFLGAGYKELFVKRVSHFTPSGTEQKFITAVFQKTE